MKKDKRRKVTPETIKKMQELREEGMTFKKIADKLNLSYCTVYKYLTVEKQVEKEEKVIKEEKAGFFARLKKKLGL